MYHHRYQPPPHLANKTAPAYANNYTINSYPPSSSSTTTSNSNLNNNNTSYSGLPNHIIEERQDVIFRKVRGILNKITPETFDKLSKELVNVGLDSPRTLRGVIYLLFDKALKDLKYSSLYAKLCQELSEKAPNFEQESGPNTFCKFLISKCEDEFERRRKATEDFDSKNELTDEEYEQKAIAKQKMLGNIKFICELGKKRLLQEEILHECIRGLLSKKKERPVQDQAQDLECLCQIMRTIGSLLDIQASRNLMNQYFERIDLFSKKPELPSRIRFMLRDVIDLRNNNWRPRPFQREDNVPQPLSKLREEAGYEHTNNSSMDRFGNSRSLIGISDLSKLHGNKLSMLLDDEPSFTTSTDFHWGPAFLPHDQNFDAFSSNSTVNNQAKLPSATTNSNTSLPSTISFQKGPVFKLAGSTKEQDKKIIEAPTLNTTVTKHPNEIVKKVSQGFGFEKRSFSDTNTTMRNFREPVVDNRGKPAVILNPHRLQQREPRDEKLYNAPRRFVEARQPQQIPSVPSSSPPMQSRRPPELSQPTIMNNPPLQQNSYDHRPHIADDRRERRYNRPDYPVHDHRPSRFTNSSGFRQNRHDRPPHREHHYFEKSNQSESDMNFNWRSAPAKPDPPQPAPNEFANKTPSAPTTMITPTSNHKPSPGTSNDQIESKIAADCMVKPAMLPKTNVIQFADMNRTFDELFPDNRHPTDRIAPVNRSERDRDHLVEKNLKEKPPGTMNYLVFQQQRTEQLNNPPRFTDVRQSQVNRPIHISPSRQAPRRPYIEPSPQPPIPQQPPSAKNHRYPPRNVQVDQIEKKEPRKFQPDHPRQGVEHQHNLRTNDNMGFQSERNFRPQQHQPQQQQQPSSGRNHLVDNSSNLKAERLPTWRRGVNIPNNNPPQREAPTTNLYPSPLLPKPPSKISDANFSLRPSHNLVGRAPVNMSASPLSNSNTKIEPSLGEVQRKKEATDSSQDNNKTNQNFNTLSGSNINPSPVTNSTTENAPDDAKNESTNSSPNRSAAREFHVNKFVSVLCECSTESSQNLSRIVAKIKELKIPKNYQQDCLLNAMKRSISQTESDRDNVSKLFVQLIPAIFESSSLLNAFRVLFEQLHSLEVETPRVKSSLARFLSQAVLDNLISLEEVGNVLSGGKHHPLFLLFLQKLEKSGGQAWLIEKFISSKINLINMLPEVDRSKDRLASILKDRCLGFLDPMLTIEPDLCEQMKDKDPSPAAVYRWIKDNVDSIIQGSPSFAHVLISCLMKYIHNVAIEKSKAVAAEESESGGMQSNKSSPSSSSQSSGDVEKELLTRYQQVLQAILKDKQMQLATLYALQSFYYGLDFPKGSLLRWFHMLYDMNIVDDDVFFTWKEEINDGFPGKGQALFQVNTWLNWLAEAESEEEEEV